MLSLVTFSSQKVWVLELSWWESRKLRCLLIGELFKMKLGRQIIFSPFFSPSVVSVERRWREGGAEVEMKWEKEHNYSYMSLVYLVV